MASYDYSLKTADSSNHIECLPLQNQYDQLSWQKGLFRGKMQNYARMLVDTPSNMMTPTQFSAQVKEFIKKEALDSVISVQELNVEEIEALNMNCFLAVAKGSIEPPRLLILNYKGALNDPQIHAGLVGKGITFDS